MDEGSGGNLRPSTRRKERTAEGRGGGGEGTNERTDERTNGRWEEGGTSNGRTQTNDGIKGV